MKRTLLIILPTLFTLAACGSGSSDTKQVTPPVSTNAQPVAVISTEQSEYKINTPIIFSAENSSDPDGDTLTYQWQLSSTDNQQNISLNTNNQRTVEFSVSKAQDYTLELVVSDGKISSSVVSKQITVTSNAQLIANAGSTQTVKQGDVVKLTAAQSTATNAVINSYQWQFTNKPTSSTTQLENSTRVNSQFIADKVGEYSVKLTITNSVGDTASSNVLIKSEQLTVNSAPNAVISVQNSTLSPNQLVTLNGEQSTDPDTNDTLSYQWAITSKPENSDPSLSDAIAKNAGFASNELGDYIISLSVTDEGNLSDTAQVTLTVATENKAPIAVLTEQTDITLNTLTTLQCQQCSDPDNDPLTYNWQLQAKPENSTAQLQQNTSATPSLTADVEGDYVVTLIVSDGELSSPQATSVLHAKDNKKPVTLVSYKPSISVDEQAILDASASYDPEGAVLSYHWEIVSSSNQAVLSSTSSSAPTLSAPTEGQVVVSLKTNDGEQFSDTQTLTINVTQNAQPVIMYTGELVRYSTVGSTVTFDASQSYDPEGTSLSYVWELSTPTDSSANLSSTNQNITELTPDLTGNYTLTFTVTDADNYQAITQFSVTATNSSQITGNIKGQITNVQRTAISNAKLTINNVPYTTNSAGQFNETLNLAEGENITIASTDPRLANAIYNSPAITQNNFTIDLEQNSLPVFQSVEVTVFVCPEFTGPDTINVNFSMTETLLASARFEYQFNQTQALVLQKSGSTYLDSELLIDLPATAKFEVTVTESNVENTYNWPITIFYSASDDPRSAIINICNI